MSKKLTKEELVKKKKYHERKVSYYNKKIDSTNKESLRIGFIYYDKL